MTNRVPGRWIARGVLALTLWTGSVVHAPWAPAQQTEGPAQQTEGPAQQTEGPAQQPEGPAQTPAAEQGGPTLTPTLPSLEDVAEQLESLRANTTLADPARTSLTDAYAAALNSLKASAEAEQQTAELAAAAETAPERLAEAQTQANAPLEAPTAPVASDAPLEEVQAAKTAAETELAALRSRFDAVQEAQRSRRDEAAKLPQRMGELQNTLETLQAQEAATSESEDPQLAEALRIARVAAIAQAKAELELAEQKLRTYESEASLLPLQEEMLQRQLTAAAQRLDLLSRQLTIKRQDVVEVEVEDFERALATGTPRLRESAALTAALLAQWPKLIRQTRSAETELLELRSVYASLRSDLERTRSLVETDLQTGGGLSRSVGYLLQRKRNKLPPDSELAEVRRRQHGVVEAAQDILTRIDARLEELPPPAIDENGQLVEPPLVTAERKILNLINRDAERLVIDTLIPLGVQRASYASTVSKYRQLVDENLLWVRSDAPFRWSDVWGMAGGFEWLLRTEHLYQIVSASIGTVQDEPATVVGCLFAIVLLFVAWPWLSRKVTRIGESVSRRPAMRMRPTFQAMLATIALALPLALLLGLPGWLLSRDGQEDAFILATADAMLTIAAAILPLEFLRHLVRPCGVAAAHFQWPSTATGALRRAVQWAIVVILPLMFFWRLLFAQSDVRPELAAAARALFAVMMSITALIMWRLADPRRGAPAVLIAASPDGWIDKLRWFWHPLVAAVPLGLALLTMLGYTYSSTQLALRLYRTLWMLIVIAVLAGFALRWLMISRRRIALQQMRERAVAKENQPMLEGTPVETFDENQADVSTINQQTRRLIDAAVFVGILIGLYWIWSPVLPAIGFLERVSLWEQTGDAGEVLDTVTLSNLLLAIPILALTFIFVRNAPGLLETVLLQRLPLENAVRYAITTLTSYLLAGLGIIMAAGTLGLHWSSIQWLVAGLGVGLGFGLQEIFANFISGIILLFEQPIRVGDVVTLDTTTGVVSRIRMRATTITNWDRQEYVVPNKDFITGRLVNWTLSDATNRVVINVGIAYGSDTRQACQVLAEICASHPDVLADPGPVITFEGFGDSTLNLVLRFYLASLERRLMAIHDMHTLINERFADEGIEIAFPQRDIHIRSVPKGMST